MEFQEVIESIKAEEASVAKLFGGDGQGVRQGKKSPQYMAKLGEAAQFYADVLNGRRASWQLREALGTSDFSNLFGDILDRQLLGSYLETPVVYRNFARIGTVSDFRTVKRFVLNGSEAVLSVVPQQAEYPESSVTDGVYSYSVQKYGRRIGFSWEAIMNDDLDALKSIPERFGKAARRSESKFATQLYCDASGPHASFYTVGNANKVTSNPVLSTAALQTAMKILAAQTDADSEPITIDAVHLVVPPALEIAALNILNALQMEIVESGGTSNQKLIAANWMRNKLTLSVEPQIKNVATTANADTSWWLFAAPSAGRPALEIGFLRGHESPEVFIKVPNASMVGGGSDALNGDFDTDTVQYKVRHVFGGTRMDPKMTVASNGSGS